MEGIISEENFSESYVCSMSADIDLTLRDDLAGNVQDYIIRIVDELHLISRWTTDCCRYMLVSQEKQKREHACRGTFEQDQAVIIAAEAADSPQSLLFQTDLELLRQEMQRSQLELYQRCTSNIAYMQNSFRTEHDEQLNELQRRFDDRIRFFTQQTIGIIEKHHSESDTRVKSVETSIRQLQKQLSVNQIELSSFEISSTAALTTLSSSVCMQQSDTVSCIRRVENTESSLSLQLNDFRSGVDESLHSLKAAHSQLSSKIQVVRLELQENSEDCQRKLQQLSKHLQSRSATTGNRNQDAGARMPSFISQKTTGAMKELVPPGTSSTSSYAQSSSMRMRYDTLDFVSSNSNFSARYPDGVKIPTGAEALATPDCFLYAKAALPQRNGVTDACLRKTTAPAISLRMKSPGGPGEVFPSGADQPSPLRSPSAERTRHSGTPAVLDNVLVIQQSVLSQPLGREDNDLEPFSRDQGDVPQLSSPDFKLTEEKQASARPATVPTPTIRASITIDGVTSTPSSPTTATSTATSPRKFQASRLAQQGGVSTSSNFLRSPVPSRSDLTRGR